MSDDIRAGDVVVCVDARPNPHAPRPLPLRKGCLYRVRDIDPIPDAFGDIGLALDGVEAFTGFINGWSFEGFFSVRRFRKIDAADEQFTEQVRACRPIHVAAGYGQKVVVR